MTSPPLSPPLSPHLPPTVQPARVLVWALHLALPVVALWLLLARPEADITWQHSPSHFWLVLTVAGVNVYIGARISATARRHTDARLFLVSLAFLISAGFFALHALATPGILISHPNTGFDVAQPVGLALASVFAVASGLPFSPDRSERTFRGLVILRAVVAAALVAWAVVSLLDLPPLNRPPAPKDVEGPLTIVAIVSIVLYVVAALRFYLLHRKAPAAVLLSLVTAFALLAEAMANVTLAPKWHLSWWEWHILLTFAFGFVAYSAYVQYRREGSSAGLFDAIGLQATNRRIRAEYGAALEELVTALQERERTGTAGDVSLAPRLADRFGLTEGQTAVLDRAGTALASERELTRRLSALVDAGEQGRVGLDDDALLGEVLRRVRPAYGDVRVGLVSDGRLVIDNHPYDLGQLSGASPYTRDGRTLYPLHVKGRVAGVLDAPASARGEIEPLVATLATQLSITLENGRLYRELSTLFRQYMSPDVAAALLADPDQAALGGSLVEVTALFADLRGFTSFSEGVEPAEIVRMLNRYHGAAVPCILDNGGTIVQFVGDALLALFNAPARQNDHALRAVRAALAMQRVVEEIAAGEPGWPRLRVGANTGPALVGNIGSETLRGFNAMGDAVNVAARLQTIAEPGRVVIGEATRAALGDAVSVEPLGELTVKGRSAPVPAYVVTGLVA